MKQFLTNIMTITELRIKQLENINIKRKWDNETGSKFNEIVLTYNISEDELINAARSVAEYVTRTRNINIEKLLFINGDSTMPRHPDSFPL